ncbi:MAG: phosphopantothenoylcysteine decarboxylase, partial [Propioniciclava sp.]
PLDPVRFLGNASSGRQGVALARAARLRGAQVTVVAAHLSEPLPAGVDVVQVSSTADLAEAMTRLQPEADVLVMAVAAADFTPAETSAAKIKKDGSGTLDLQLTETIDVLGSLSARRSGPPRQVIVGFAAETAKDDDDLLALGLAKLARKGCDLLVLNNVSGGAVFGQPDNTITIIDPDRVVLTASGDKAAVAHRIWDAVVATRTQEDS